VLLTGSPALDTAMEAVEHGAFRYLVKPVAASRLVEVVVRATQLRALARLKHEAPQIIDVGRQPRGERAALAVRFDNALAKLWTAFQPIVRWSDRRVYGYEALVRSGEPSLASAPDLLDVAEQLGRLHDLGRAVRAYVSRCAHQAPGNALIFVNLRPADLTDPELPAAAAPLSAMAERVVLEVTERESLEQVAGVTSHVAALRRLGYRLAVDDLGAGYAGLTAVTQLAPDFVKLDKELVHGLDRLPRKRSVVRAMLRLCGGDLGIRVVSEGIETTGERDVITAEGGDLLQGYLFARPGPGFGGASWT
jgi:EAL domain-containing protein (putative c-di-GMP-specific phosphodiesterase class I)